MESDHIDLRRRRFLIRTSKVLAGIGVAAASIPFLASWQPSRKARAAAQPLEVDISQLEPGALMTIEWRQKPIWIVHRTATMLRTLQGHDSELRDPNSLVNQQPFYAKNYYRSIKPDYLVLVGICTHLGCSPLYLPNPGEVSRSWRGGFFCPCHGSKFDLAGRVFVNVPAPINLEVPPYHFQNPTLLIIGEDPTTS